MGFTQSGDAATQREAEGLAGRVRPLTLADERLLPVPAAFRELVPGGGLRRGSTVSVRGSVALALALVAAASAAGSWVAAVGLPHLGVVAAAEAGIALERFALVPAVEARMWATVVATLLDAVDVVLVRPPAGRAGERGDALPGRPPEAAVGLPAGQARRLAARARERGSVLVVLGHGWGESVDLRLALLASRWKGLGQGHGRLTARMIQVEVTGRGAAVRERRAWLWLPGPDAARGGPYAERIDLTRFDAAPVRSLLERAAEPGPELAG